MLQNIINTLDGWKNGLIDAILRLSQSNLSLLVLFAAAIALLGLLYFMPKINLDEMFTARRDSKRFSEQMIYQAKRFTSSNLPLRKRLVQFLFREGNASSDIVIDNNQFFLLLRLITSFLFGLFAGVVVIVFKFDAYFTVLPILGFLLPLLVVGLYNRRRRGKIKAALPKAAVRLRTRISAENRIADAFLKAAEGQKGPLWDEMRMAARQMTDALPYEPMKEIDRRNNIVFFGEVAVQIERAGARNKEEAKNVFAAYMDRKSDENFSLKEEKLGGLVSKVNVVMIPFLLFGMLLAAGSTLLINLINGTGI